MNKLAETPIRTIPIIKGIKCGVIEWLATSSIISENVIEMPIAVSITPITHIIKSTMFEVVVIILS